MKKNNVREREGDKKGYTTYFKSIEEKKFELELR